LVIGGTGDMGGVMRLLGGLLAAVCVALIV